MIKIKYLLIFNVLILWAMQYKIELKTILKYNNLIKCKIKLLQN